MLREIKKYIIALGVEGAQIARAVLDRKGQKGRLNIACVDGWLDDLIFVGLFSQN